MTIDEVIRELANIKNYCTASALPALDYAIAVLEHQKQAGAAVPPSTCCRDEATDF